MNSLYPEESFRLSFGQKRQMLPLTNINYELNFTWHFNQFGIIPTYQKIQRLLKKILLLISMNRLSQGDALNKEKRNSQNAWIPTTHWLGGFMWHYVQCANRENFLYDLRCIDGIMHTRYGEGQFYLWHNDAGLQTQYNP